jgi:hypothetical protein
MSATSRAGLQIFPSRRKLSAGRLWKSIVNLARPNRVRLYTLPSGKREQIRPRIKP